MAINYFYHKAYNNWIHQALTVPNTSHKVLVKNTRENTNGGLMDVPDSVYVIIPDPSISGSLVSRL